jgi:flagellar biosynthesis/type III secretory pathway chaperone
MDQVLTTSFELLERRLALMRDLAGSLERAQSAVVLSDLPGMDGHTARQGEICKALRLLEAEALQHPACTAISSGSRSRKVGMQLPEDAVSPLVRQRWKRLAQDLTQVEIRVRQLNQVYGALLRRARRTVQIFNRVLASSATTYAPPKPEFATAQLPFQEISHV